MEKNGIIQRNKLPVASAETTEYQGTCKRSARLPILPPCRVCGNRASGLHYGVNTCEGCKGFFRRTMTKGLTYTCTGTGSLCPLIPKKRNNCQACRFNKCIQVGMSTKAIKTGRYTHTKRTQYIKEIKYLEENRNSDPRHSDFQVSSSADFVQFPQDRLTSSTEWCDSSEDTTDVAERKIGPEAQTLTFDCENLKDKDKLNSGKSSLTTKQWKYNCMLKPEEHVPLDKENSELIETLLRLQDDFLEDLDSFLDEEKMKSAQLKYAETLDSSPTKRGIIADEETDEIRETSDESVRDKMADSLAAMINTELRRVVQFVKSIPGWKQVPMEDRVFLIKESQVEFWLLGHYLCINKQLGVFTGEFTTSYEETKAAQLYEDKYLELLYKTAESFKTLHLSKVEVTLLRVITLTFTDRGTLKDPEAVEKIHLRMIECLKAYYLSIGISFNRRFAHIIDRLTEARTLTDSFNNLTVSIIRRWPVMKKYPLLEEFYTLPPQHNT